MSVSVSVIGARGYSGLELARLLLQHPHVRLTHAFATQKFSLADELLDRRAFAVNCLTDDLILQNLTDIVFLATPPEVSLNLVPKILQAGKKVIDLSGAFRLKEHRYQEWYHFEHTAPEVLKKASYGLVPFCEPFMNGTGLIANPGCFATTVNMALIPLLKRGLIETEHLVIDAKSGTTGAGRKAAEHLLFSEVDGNCLPYRVGHHQHLPEIIEIAKAFADSEIKPHFSTHLLPVKRGILASIYAFSRTTNLEKIEEAFQEEYADYPFVGHGKNISQWASLNKVVGTPRTQISYQLVGRQLYLFSTIDNLMKGAASQAVENLNRLLDLPLQTGLAG